MKSHIGFLISTFTLPERPAEASHLTQSSCCHRPSSLLASHQDHSLLHPPSRCLRKAGSGGAGFGGSSTTGSKPGEGSAQHWWASPSAHSAGGGLGTEMILGPKNLNCEQLLYPIDSVTHSHVSCLKHHVKMIPIEMRQTFRRVLLNAKIFLPLL